MEEMELTMNQMDHEEPVKTESPRWYEGYISLEDAKTFIKANIATAARSFIAIGFYLKCVRDRELFLEEDHPDVWEFAKSEYGISKSTASRYMSMNDRFSENGNSPNVREEYRSYGKSQLQEMLYLEEDQLEQVTPQHRVEDIRGMRKPKEVPYIELPGQMEIEIDFPEYMPEPSASLISQKQTFEMRVEDMLSGEGQDVIAISQQDQEPEPEEIQDPEEIRKKEWLIRCEVLKELCDALCDMHSYGLEKDRYSMAAIQRLSRGSYGFGFSDDGYGHSKYEANYKNSQYHVKEFNGDSKWIFESGEIDQYIWNFNKREWHKEHPEGQKQESSLQPDPEFYNPDDEKKVNESYSMAELPGAHIRLITMLAQLFVRENVRRLFGNGEFIGITDEDIIDMLKLFQRRNRESIIIDDDVEVAVCAEIIEFSRGDEDLGVCSFKKFTNFARKQIDEYIDQMAKKQENHDLGESVSKMPGTVIEEPEDTPEQPESVPDCPETVIDGEFVEVLPEQELSARLVLEEEKKELQSWTDVFDEAEEKYPPMVERQKIIVAALTAMVAELEKPEPEPEPEPEKQEQPELPILKNNDQRKEFIENYTTWPLWIETKETGERYYRYNLSDKIAMVVKVSWRHSWIDYKKSDGYEYGAEQYYLLGVGTEWKAGKNVYVEDDTRTFYECNSNMSALVEYLKEFQKKGKGEA